MAATQRVKDKKVSGLVEPGNVYNYLKEKGVSHTHALGIMTNLNSESGWNPSVVGDSGNAIGLFQHNGPRKAELLKYINGDTSDWKKQIDFALQESGSSTYLNKQFSNAESAGEYFMKNWERPKNQSNEAVSERLSWLKTWGGGAYSDPNYVPTSSASISSADYDTTPGVSTGLAQDFLVAHPQDYHRKAEEFKKAIAVENEKAKKIETDGATKELTAAQIEHNKRIEFLNIFNTPKEASDAAPVQEQTQEFDNGEDLYTQNLGFDLQDTSTPLFKTRLDLPETTQEFKDGGTQGDGLYTHSGHNYKKIDGKWYMEPVENSGNYKLIEKGDVKSRISELERNAQAYTNKGTSSNDGWTPNSSMEWTDEIELSNNSSIGDMLNIPQAIATSSLTDNKYTLPSQWLEGEGYSSNPVVGGVADFVLDPMNIFLTKQIPYRINLSKTGATLKGDRALNAWNTVAEPVSKFDLISKPTTNSYADGGRKQSLSDLTIDEEYHYQGRPTKAYKLNDNGEWLIKDTTKKNDKWVAIKDPTGERAATLERSVIPKTEYLNNRQEAIQKELEVINGQNNKFYLPDTRTIRATTGRAINPNVDLMAGDYSEDVVKEIITKAREKGVDPKTALAIALQESQFGKKDSNLGHSTIGDTDPYSYMDILKSKIGLAKSKGHTDEYKQLQFYNGTGKLFPNTEAGYHGFTAGKFYGVPVTEAGLDMMKNPLYGKQIVDLRDNVIGKSEHIDSLLNVKHFDDGGITGEEESPVYTYSGRPGSTYQKDKNNNWLIKNEDTNGSYVPIKDPTGARAKTLNAQATQVYQSSQRPLYNPKFDQVSESTNVNNTFAKDIPIGKFNLLEEGFQKTVNQQKIVANKVHNYMKGYQNSPRYEEMLKQSEPENWQDWQDARQRNLFGYENTFGDKFNRLFVPGAKNYKDDPKIPKITIAREQGNEGLTGGFSESNTGNITVLPNGYNVQGLLPHETSHTEDRPLQSRINLRTGLPYPDNMMNSQRDQRLIPAKDQAYIYKSQAKNWSDTEDYKSMSDWQKKYYKDNPEEYKQQEDFIKYVGEPTETRARLNDLRYQSKQKGIYDPFTEKVTPKTYKKLLKTKFETEEKQGFDALHQLKSIYSDKEIQWMLNNISQNQSQEEDGMSQGYGRYGGTQPSLNSLLDIDKLEEFRGRYTQEFRDGGKVVSELWKEQTGLDWSEAKRSGKTDGSLEGNLKLKSELEASAPTISNQQPKAISTDIQSAPDFNSAFKIARSTLGANKIFEYDGRQYGTNLSGETFNPSDEDIKASGLDLPKTKARLQDENSRVTSIYSNKTTVKLQPNEYEDWNKIKQRTTELNKTDNAQKIITSNKNRNLTSNYVIIDKKKGLMHIYDPKGNDLFSSAVDLGKNEGDAQTTTKYVDQNKDGKITNADKVNGKFKVDWSAGNMSTGAGKFYISNIDKQGLDGLPLLNMMNEAQYEKYKKTGKVENVSTSFHKGYVKDDESRVSNGCIRCNKTSLDNLTKYLQSASEVYILPEDENNSFVFENGKLNFKAKSTNDYTKYRDSKGKNQKGEGINRGVNTLNYKPIKAELNKAKFQNDKFTALDFNDDEEYKNVEEFTKALASSKRAVMKVAKINGDVYNELAKMTFGIFGTETNFADTHSLEGNIVRAIRKGVDRKSNSSPDYLEKYHLFGADEKTNSVGLTQIRWSYLNADEKAALKQVGITSNKDFMNPKKAAIGTTVVLGVRYNQQLTNKEKQDIWKNLPTKWNSRGNYADRVKSNSKYLSIKQKS